MFTFNVQLYDNIEYTDNLNRTNGNRIQKQETSTIQHLTYMSIAHDSFVQRELPTSTRPLWSKREEYQEFDLPIFKERIYQEIRRTKFINWMEMKREEGDPQVKRMSLYEWSSYANK
jgi:hypothetical protein